MCVYQAIHQNTEISFLPGSIFQEKGQIVIKNPKNSDDFNDKPVPPKIPLKDLQMTQEQREKIEASFHRKKTEKEQSKARKERAAIRQI